MDNNERFQIESYEPDNLTVQNVKDVIESLSDILKPYISIGDPLIINSQI